MCTAAAAAATELGVWGMLLFVARADYAVGNAYIAAISVKDGEVGSGGEGGDQQHLNAAVVSGKSYCMPWRHNEQSEATASTSSPPGEK